MKVIDMITKAVSPLGIDTISYDLESDTAFTLTYSLINGRFKITYSRGEYEIDSNITQYIGLAQKQDYEMFQSVSLARTEVERALKIAVSTFDSYKDILFREVNLDDFEY